MTKKLIVSSGNKHKLEEIKKILNDLNLQIQSKDEIGFSDFDVLEDKDTLEGNALKKAKALWEKTGGFVISDDTGLFVDALDGRPGVYSARYAGEDATYDDNCNKMLEELENISYDKRTAQFSTVIALIDEKGKEYTVKGTVEGYILAEKRGTNGFGYDPIFYVDDYKKTFAELTDNEKNSISHRGRALQKLKKLLGEIL
jgi:XTP/dITP diphosphohydrolase